MPAGGSNLAYGTVELHFGANRFTQLFKALDSPASTASTVSTGIVRLGSEATQRDEAGVQRIIANPRGWIPRACAPVSWLFIDSGEFTPFANGTAFRRAWERATTRPWLVQARFPFWKA